MQKSLCPSQMPARTLSKGGPLSNSGEWHRTTYSGSSQENSLGHNSLPVCSLAKPRLSFDRARRGGSEAPYMSTTQVTTAVLRWLVSSPLAMSAPLRNWKTWYQKHPNRRKIKTYIFI